MSVLEFTAPPGPILAQSFPNPAAGADLTITTPDTAAAGMWGIVSIRARLVTSATVANRLVAVVVKDQTADEVYRVGFDTAITASKTVIVTASPAVATVAGGVSSVLAVTFPLPFGPYPSRTAISTVTTAIDTGDQWSQVSVLYQRFSPNYFQE